MKRNIFYKSLNLTLLLIFLGFSTALANEKSYIFQNNTGREVNDLHIEFTEEGVEYNSNSEEKKNMADKKASHNIDNNDGKIHHFKFKGRRKQIPNGDYVYVDFKTDGDKEIKIKSWYWTFNDTRVSTVKIGDDNKLLQDEDMAVVSEDIVKEYKFKNGIPKVRSGNKVEEYGINDLHIVVNKPVKVNNRTRDDSNAPRKTGGVFEETQIITCDCDALPDKDAFDNRGVNTPARKRALKALNEPCRTLCETTTEKRYVVQLATDESIVKTGQEVPVRLIGADDFEIIGTPWWTKDGHPITYDEDKNKDNRGGTENKPPKDNETRDDMDQEEEEDEIFPVASFFPGFDFPERNDRGFTVGFGLGYAKTPEALLNPLSPKSNAEVLLPGLENGDIDLDLTDLAVLKMLSLQPILEKMQQSPVFSAQLGYQLDNWEIKSGYDYQSYSQEYRIVIDPEFSSGNSAKLKTDISRHNIDLSLRRYLTGSRLQPFVEAGAAISFLHARKNLVTQGESSYTYDKCKWLTPWGVIAISGLRYNLSDAVFTEFKAGLNYYNSNNTARGSKGVTYPEFGINLGIRLSR